MTHLLPGHTSAAHHSSRPGQEFSRQVASTRPLHHSRPSTRLACSAAAQEQPLAERHAAPPLGSSPLIALGEQPQALARSSPGAGSTGGPAAGRPGVSSKSWTKGGSAKREARQSDEEVADKLIAVFRARKSSEWRKLIAFSKQWNALAHSFFARLTVRVREAASDEERSELKMLTRRLTSVHEELLGYDALLQKMMASKPGEWESMVALRREDFTTAFFEHVHNRVLAATGSSKKQEALATAAARLLALVDAYDGAARDQEALSDASATFQELLQVGSKEEAESRIDELAATGKLQPALLLTMAKAYASVKDTDYTREEVKDVMAHLYFTAQESFARQQPPDVRIMKALLLIEDPMAVKEGLEAAFTPGGEAGAGTAKEDFLSTTPTNLLAAVDTVLQAYQKTRNTSSMIGEAAQMMRPEVISRLETIKELIVKGYM